LIAIFNSISTHIAHYVQSQKAIHSIHCCMTNLIPAPIGPNQVKPVNKHTCTLYSKHRSCLFWQHLFIVKCFFIGWLVLEKKYKKTFLLFVTHFFDETVAWTCYLTIRFCGWIQILISLIYQLTLRRIRLFDMHTVGINQC
jgi:hypothetical protein